MKFLALCALVALLGGGCNGLAINTTALRPELCLNQTDIVLESIRTQSTINATATTIEASKTCGADYTWTGSECTKKIVTDGHCAPGYEWLSGRCERVESALCPNGYQKSNTSDNCVLRVEFNVDCPPQHTWDGENCVHSMPSCRPGYQLLNGNCVKLVAGVCPVGTQMELGKCVRTQTTIVECSDGFELIGTECRRSGEIICDANTQLVDGHCVRTQIARPEYACPPDMRLEGTKCVSRVQRCPSGYVLNGTRCENVTISCPPNSTMDENHQCVRHECRPVQPHCKDGYEMSNGFCFLKPEVPSKDPLPCNSSEILVNNKCQLRCPTVEPECGPFADLEGNRCVARNSETTLPWCPAGFVLNGNWCVDVRSPCVISLPSCEPNFEWRDNQCVRKQLPITCNNGFVLRDKICVPQCPPGNVWQNNRCEAVCPDGQQPHGDRCLPRCPTVEPECGPFADLVGNRCVARNSETTLPWCPEGFALSDNWCVDVRSPCVIYPPQCEPNFEWRDNQCVRKQLPQCPPGTVWQNNRCEVVCPDGQQPHGDRCVPRCPTVEPECGPFADLEGNRCVARNSKPTLPSCPAGFVLSDKWCVDVRSACVISLPLCEPNFELRDNQCIRKRCPNGFKLRDNKCEIVCPNGYYVDGDRCVYCPPNFVLRNGTCYEVGVPPVCPIGYDLKNGMCFCGQKNDPILEQPTICPTNQTQLPNGTCVAKPICPTGQEISIADGLCHRITCRANEWPNSNGTCITTNCSPGFRFNNTLGKCVPVCPNGYEQRPNGDCIRLTPSVCTPGPCNPTPNINGTIQTSTNCSSSVCGSGVGIGGGGNNANIVHSVTIVDRPVNVLTNNENNVNVYIYENGNLVSIQRNNGTQIDVVGNVTVDEVTTPVPEFVEEPNCCVVVSPRKCEQIDGQWDCKHRETRRCGWFCTSPKIYLIPRRNEYREHVLVMRPPPSWHTDDWNTDDRNTDESDCSGCVHGSYSCASYCYQYETCAHQDECRYVDQQSFCEMNAGDGCGEEDGCFD